MFRQKQTEESANEWRQQTQTAEPQATVTPEISLEERVTPEEWEAIAARVGIQTQSSRTTPRETVRVRAIRPLRRTMTRRERFLVAGIPLIYGLNVFVTCLLMRHPPEEMISLLCFILPQLIAVMLGLVLARKGRAVLAGVLANACTVAAVIAAIRVVDGSVHGSPQDWQITCLMLLGGALSGAFGAVLRQAFTRRRSEV